MDETPHQHRRTGHAVVPPERMPPRREHRHKELMFFAGVGLAVLVVLGLYAASFRYQPAFQELQRNGLGLREVTADISKQAGSLQQSLTQLDQARDSISAILDAKIEQVKSIELLKNRIVSASATASATSAH